MRTLSKQNGASTPLTLLFVGMAAILLTIIFKLYPSYYEHWQISAVLDSYAKDVEVESMTVDELESNFLTRLMTNNVRGNEVREGFFAERTDNAMNISVEYEVRVPIYKNIDAIIYFEKSVENKF
jgi:hypothetical protein